MDAFPSSPLVPAALVQLSNLARWNASGLGIADYLLSKATTLPRAADRARAQRLAYLAAAYEGRAADALAGLEELMDHAPNPQDSMRALADAMGVYFFRNPDKTLQPRHAQVKTDDVRVLAQRLSALAKRLESSNLMEASTRPPVPTSYCLYQNYPNPFNPITDIRFDLPEAVHVELKVFNILGQEVATLLDEVRPAGAYRVPWDSKTTSGMSVASGVYVYQITAGAFTDSKKMVLIR